jgi:hypothetical protein
VYENLKFFNLRSSSTDQIRYFLVEKNNLNEKTICNGVEKKVLVVDCRSYAVTFANRVKGGGSECIGTSSIVISCYGLF